MKVRMSWLVESSWRKNCRGEVPAGRGRGGWVGALRRLAGPWQGRAGAAVAPRGRPARAAFAQPQTRGTPSPETPRRPRPRARRRRRAAPLPERQRQAAPGRRGARAARPSAHTFVGSVGSRYTWSSSAEARLLMESRVLVRPSWASRLVWGARGVAGGVAGGRGLGIRGLGVGSHAAADGLRGSRALARDGPVEPPPRNPAPAARSTTCAPRSGPQTRAPAGPTGPTTPWEVEVLSSFVEFCLQGVALL
jgi:hypothetical protein